MIFYVKLNSMENTLYYGDNFWILREYIKDETVDLIYLDPPFNSKANYNILYKEPTGEPSQAQITAFEDTWHWGDESESVFREIINIGSAAIGEMITSLKKFLNPDDMMAYLVMMCIRLIELNRVLKDTGSIYLHCDPVASHYLKIVMDTIFGKKNFKNEIIWHYRKWPSGNRQFQRNHDCILFYSKADSSERIFNQIDLMERTESTLKRFKTSKIVSGYDEDGNRLPSQMQEEESKGVPRDDVWDIGRVPPIKQLFPTQKPDLLLSRIIRASSNEGDVILDPFCGCGTTIIEAHKHNRKWIGIDVTHLSINLIKWRLNNLYDLIPKKDYKVIGEPTDLSGAKELAKNNRYQFEWWALSLIGARPYRDKKKGPDTGIDGLIYFSDEQKKIKKILVSVKSGNTSVKDIRDLCHVIDREQAEIGILLTLNEPTKPMKHEAYNKGYYNSKLHHKEYPKIQIYTIEELFSGKKINIPHIIHPKLNPDHYRKYHYKGLELK
jgi:site-specific DNA-methyltransferase (adenine-specific)